jgi:phage-related holin
MLKSYLNGNGKYSKSVVIILEVTGYISEILDSKQIQVS